MGLSLSPESFSVKVSIVYVQADASGRGFAVFGCGSVRESGLAIQGTRRLKGLGLREVCFGSRTPVSFPEPVCWMLEKTSFSVRFWPESPPALLPDSIRPLLPWRLHSLLAASMTYPHIAASHISADRRLKALIQVGYRNISANDSYEQVRRRGACPLRGTMLFGSQEAARLGAVYTKVP